MPFSGIFFLPMIFLLSFSRFRRLASSHKKRIVKMEIPLHNSWSEWKYLSRLKTAPLEIKTEARAVRKQFARLIMTAPPCLCLSSLSIQEKPRDCNMGFSPKTGGVSEKKSAFSPFSNVLTLPQHFRLPQNMLTLSARAAKRHIFNSPAEPAPHFLTFHYCFLYWYSIKNFHSWNGSF